MNAAYHEAGHLVVGVYYNSKGITDIVHDSITITPNQDYYGKVDSEHLSRYNPSNLTDEIVKAHIFSSLAGYSAQKIFESENVPLGHVKDFETVKEYMQY